MFNFIVKTKIDFLATRLQSQRWIGDRVKQIKLCNCNCSQLTLSNIQSVTNKIKVKYWVNFLNFIKCILPS